MPSPSSVEQLRLLLIQARNTDEMELQEQTCFLERCRVKRHQVQPLNVTRTPLPPDLLDEVDALMIGGAGEYSALDDTPWMPALLDVVRVALERRLPTFGSCWGHQIIARALGGTVIHDPECAELGCGTVKLTEAGQSDPLFASFPPSFNANMGHHDRVSVLPPNAVELAYNDTQRNQAFRMSEAPVYGTQFHSELDAARERERLIAYREYYRQDLPDEDEFQEVLDSLAETTEVDSLLHDFLLTFTIPSPDASTRSQLVS
jgi:GMP synthase (glutamine-hydrolysing)